MQNIDQISIRDTCQSLSIRFGRLQDERKHDDLADLMTEDATYVRLGEELRVSEFIAWIKTTPRNITRHVVTPTEIELLDSHTATGLTYYTIYLYGGDEEAPYPLAGPFVVGEYHETFKLTDKGWKIHRREARIVFRKAK